MSAKKMKRKDIEAICRITGKTSEREREREREREKKKIDDTLKIEGRALYRETTHKQ